MELYAHDSGTVAVEVMEWCLKNGADPDYRIVLAGFEGEGHEALEAQGWRVAEWYAAGYLTGGYGNQSERGPQQHRERLWLSPHCLSAAPDIAPLPDDDEQDAPGPASELQPGLFDDTE